MGLLDAFWEQKNYVTPEEFKSFCNSTVPLARLRRVFTTAETLNADLELAHFGPEPIENAIAVWKIIGGPGAQGESEARTVPIGKNIPMGKATFDLSKLAPGEYKLVLTVAPVSFFTPVDRKIIPGRGVVRGVTYFENDWRFWVFPAGGEIGNSPDCPPSGEPEPLVTRSWEEAEKRLATGGRVLFVPYPSDLNWTNPPLDFVPIFFNRLTTPGWSRSLGLWINRPIEESKSRALDGFPTSTHFDWQWAQIIQNVRAVNLDHWPAELEPIVWAIDDWNRNYKLGVIFEAAVGDGRLLVSAFDITRPNETNPVARQLRNVLLRYAKSDCFQPNVSLEPSLIRTLFFDTLVMKKLGAVAEVDGASANNLVDGDPNTFVRVGQQGAELREQVDIIVRFRSSVALRGLVLMPRQGHREHEGDIRSYAVQVSDDGLDWRDVARGELVSTFAPQQIAFSRTVTARYLKLISLSGFGPDKTTSLAELAVIYAGPKLAEQK